MGMSYYLCIKKFETNISKPEIRPSTSTSTKSIRRNDQFLLLICKLILGIRKLTFSKLSLDIFQVAALPLI